MAKQRAPSSAGSKWSGDVPCCASYWPKFREGKLMRWQLLRSQLRARPALLEELSQT
jgi:hypothetical protein